MWRRIHYSLLNSSKTWKRFNNKCFCICVWIVSDTEDSCPSQYRSNALYLPLEATSNNTVYKSPGIWIKASLTLTLCLTFLLVDWFMSSWMPSLMSYLFSFPHLPFLSKISLPALKYYVIPVKALTWQNT